jgi:outer membrane biosynthesis protein TonB
MSDSEVNAVLDAVIKEAEQQQHQQKQKPDPAKEDKEEESSGEEEESSEEEGESSEEEDKEEPDEVVKPEPVKDESSEAESEEESDAESEDEPPVPERVVVSTKKESGSDEESGNDDDEEEESGDDDNEDIPPLIYPIRTPSEPEKPDIKIVSQTQMATDGLPAFPVIPDMYIDKRGTVDVEKILETLSITLGHPQPDNKTLFIQPADDAVRVPTPIPTSIPTPIPAPVLAPVLAPVDEPKPVGVEVKQLTEQLAATIQPTSPPEPQPQLQTSPQLLFLNQASIRKENADKVKTALSYTLIPQTRAMMGQLYKLVDDSITMPFSSAVEGAAQNLARTIQRTGIAAKSHRTMAVPGIVNEWLDIWQALSQYAP